MNEVKFTPGPWHIELKKGFSENRFLIFDDPDENGDIDSVACTSFSEHENSLANANLIAAAPDMYALLENLAEFFANGGNEGEMETINLECIKLILNKARGER